ILSSFLTDSYAVCSGTSQAAPFVAGAVALLKSYAREAGGRLRDSQVKYLLKHTSDRKDSRLRTDRWGYGRVNILDALKLLQYMQSQLN
ncbi:MAG TPA: S8 family serine peptidase, partial [Chitinophagaceae bacterium]|nr:S8 family serine peptidase [Chitinophagaceae bacterium]